MEEKVTDITRICQRAPGPSGGTIEHQRPWPVITAVGLIAVLLISAPIAYPFWAPLLNPSEYGYDLVLLDVDQDGNLLQTVTYASNMQDICSMCPKIIELATGGFAIAGSYFDRKLWVIRTDENYSTVWNRTYERPHSSNHLGSITEMNNGNLVIGHWSHDRDEAKQEYVNFTECTLVIDDEGEFVREKVWSPYAWDTFSHCGDGGFILSGANLQESILLGVFERREDDEFWIARLDADLSVIWNKTYAGLYLYPYGDIVEDIDGGFTILTSYENGGELIRLDSQGNETSRVLINSSEVMCSHLTQCSNGDYLGWTVDYTTIGGCRGWMANCIICFDTEGNTLWEKSNTPQFGCGPKGIEELSPNVYVTWNSFESVDSSGVFIDCFDASGITLWNRSVVLNDYGFTMSDVIANSDGGITILCAVHPRLLPSVLDYFSDSELSETSVPLPLTVGVIPIGAAVIGIVVLKRPSRKTPQA
ncbi:MAG: hypothetical protein ACFFAZ_15725 [Promethearchaeota archaeon]